jgi:hypothetical protein
MSAQKLKTFGVESTSPSHFTHKRILKVAFYLKVACQTNEPRPKSLQISAFS